MPRLTRPPPRAARPHATTLVIVVSSVMLKPPLSYRHTPCHSELALSLEGRSEESDSLRNRAGPSVQEKADPSLRSG